MDERLVTRCGLVGAGIMIFSSLFSAITSLMSSPGKYSRDLATFYLLFIAYLGIMSMSLLLSKYPCL
jgi:hypothetical protein